MPTYSISGNAGIAAAIVNWIQYDPNTHAVIGTGSVTADGSGNYTIPGFADGSDVVFRASLTGYLFVPNGEEVVIASANSTGNDFTAELPFTISGSLGVSGAGAHVFFTETASGYFNQMASAIADSSGNYTSSPLPNNASYLVTPVIYGAEFSPLTQTVALAGSNITGINWVGVSSHYTLTNTFTDTFNRGGVTQNPLSGWTTWGGASGCIPLQSVSNLCESTGIDPAISGAYPTGYTQPADCFCQYTLVNSADNSTLVVSSVRQTVDPAFGTAGYNLETEGQIGLANQSGLQITDTPLNQVLFSTPGYADYGMSPYTFESGDAFLLLVRGEDIYVFINRIPIAAALGTSSPNPGLTGLQILTGAIPDLGISNFIAGAVIAGSPSMAYSVPDCRVSPNGPNAGITVQGTIQYTGQTSDNSSVPGVDSRAAGAPVDSRVAPNIPENSRTPGTYGPGE